jgi:hypothetical protein
MILYTIYDHNMVLGGGNGGPASQEYQNYSEMSIDGVKVQVSQHSTSQFQVERIISTDPFDYLNPKIQPGCIISK